MSHVAEWFTFGAELVVAYVIYMEVENSRRDKFFEIASDISANEQRHELYKKFLALTGTPAERARSIQSQFQTDKELRKICTKQIAFFNDLGFLVRRRFWNWLYVFGENPAVKLLPHSVIYTWVILNPIIKHRRTLTGEWYATPLLQVVLRSVRVMLKVLSGNQKLYLGEEGENRVEIAVPDLRQIETDVAALLASTPSIVR